MRGPDWREKFRAISISNILKTAGLTAIPKRRRETEYIFEDSGNEEKTAKGPEKKGPTR